MRVRGMIVPLLLLLAMLLGPAAPAAAVRARTVSTGSSPDSAFVWLGLRGDQSHVEYTDDGTPYKINPGYHVVVAYGFDESGVYVSDPATGETTSWSWDYFMWMWDSMDGMGLAVWPIPGATEP